MALRDDYEHDGYAFPIDILDAAEAQRFRTALETDEAHFGPEFLNKFKHKPHLVTNWAWELVHHPRILDAVEAVIGPDVLCWEAVLFVKPATSPAFISWHQDLTYWGLDSDRVVSAWLALSPSTRESGCMRVVPGSHVGDIVAHTDTFAPENLLSRGQEIATEVDESAAVDIVLEPGQCSLHHVKIVHGSEPNRSADRRIGFAIRYLPPDVSQVVGAKDSATLVRGEDRFHHFEHEHRPVADYAPEVLAEYDRIRARRMKVLMRQS